MKYLGQCLLLLLSICLFWMGSVQAESSIDLIVNFEPAYSESIDQGDGLAKRKASANLNPKALNLLATGKRVSSLRVLLFPGVVFDLQGIKSDVRLVGTVVNEFSILGDERGSAVLSVTDGVLYGTVTTGANVVYRIQWEAKDVYRIEELDQSKFPECANPSGSGKSSSLEGPTNSSAIAPSTDTVASEDDGTLVKVLVAYTQAAETAAGGASSISSLIATAESETNTGYSTSGINFVINVVNTTKVTYNEATGYSAALNAITNTSDGLMDSVHGLRDTYSADLVVLIIDNSDSCGIAWKPSTVSSSNASSGFSVVGWNCATGYYSFAHEMGHNMGAGHDTYVDSSTLPYAYGHGFVNTSARVRSIMAYNDLCVDSGFNCTRVNHWSATDRLYNGSTVIGDATATHNVALNNSAYSISNYRSSSAEPPPPPTTVDASDGTYADKIAVSWSSVAAATTYNVYYSSSLGGSQTLLGQYTGTSINVTSTAPGAVWYFWVYSFNTNGESATGTYDTGYTTGTAACYALTRSHSGSGSDPSASPTYSSGCSSGNYHAGEVIDLTATPTSGWSVSGWSGTNNNSSTSTNNQVTMPSSAHAVSVTYVEAPPSDDHGNSCGTATSVGANSTTSGNIEVSGDLDYFRIDLASAGTLTVNSSGITDTYGTLKNSACADIASNDDGGVDFNFLMNQELAAGTYYVEAKGFSTSTGPYQFVSSFVPALPCYTLTRSHSGSGSDPSASPTNSSGCSSGNYHAGEVIDLAATPTSGWSVSGWSGTDNNGSTSTSNQVTMPSSARAVSVTYVEAPPPSSGETLFVPITPCRLLDTRVVGGPFGGGTTRSYWIWNGGLDTHQGGAPTCNIPSDAVAVQINFTAVDPSGFGYLRAWPNGLAEPTATMLVFYGGVSISNSVSLMFCNTCGDDMDVRIYDATTDLVAEAVGYYAPVVP